MPTMCDLKPDQIGRLWVGSNSRSDEGRNCTGVQNLCHCLLILQEQPPAPCSTALGKERTRWSMWRGWRRGGENEEEYSCEWAWERLLGAKGRGIFIKVIFTRCPNFQPHTAMPTGIALVLYSPTPPQGKVCCKRPLFADSPVRKDYEWGMTQPLGLYADVHAWDPLLYHHHFLRWLNSQTIRVLCPSTVSFRKIQIASTRNIILTIFKGMIVTMWHF